LCYIKLKNFKGDRITLTYDFVLNK
jgi:hypothetical protein